MNAAFIVCSFIPRFLTHRSAKKLQINEWRLKFEKSEDLMKQAQTEMSGQAGRWTPQVMLGKVQSRVVRNLEEGFAIEFVHEQNGDTLEESVTAR